MSDKRHDQHGSDSTQEGANFERITIEHAPGAFSALLREAQPCSAYLQRILIVASESYTDSDGDDWENLTLLIPESYVTFWRSMDSDWPLPYVAADWILYEIRKVSGDECIDEPQAEADVDEDDEEEELEVIPEWFVLTKILPGTHFSTNLRNAQPYHRGLREIVVVSMLPFEQEIDGRIELCQRVSLRLPSDMMRQCQADAALNGCDLETSAFWMVSEICRETLARRGGQLTPL